MWSSRRTRKGSPPARLARYQAALLHPFCSRPSAAYSKKPFFSLKKDASVPPLVSLKASPFSSVSLPLQASTNPTRSTAPCSKEVSSQPPPWQGGGPSHMSIHGASWKLSPTSNEMLSDSPGW